MKKTFDKYSNELSQWRKFLKESLISIVNQEFKNWELIFWDNKSTDNSQNIFLSFKDSRFKYFRSKKNLLTYTLRGTSQ